MSEYRACECPYHGRIEGFIGGADCRNKGRIKAARYAWLCDDCCDQLEAGWKYGLEHREELVVVDRDPTNSP
jgi:hypothetical protein